MRKHLAILAVIVMFIGCSANRYMVADKYLKQENFQKALETYVKLAQTQGSFKLSKDIRALTGAMISYYSLGQFKESFSLGKRILSLDNYNSAAIFYAGMSLEQAKKYSLAKKIYRYFQAVPNSDPYHSLIKSRFTKMIEKEMEERARLAVKMEQSVGVGQAIENTLAVLYFVNMLEDPRWNSVSKGLAEMMITDFAQVDELKVIERVHLQKLLEEIELGMAGLANEETAPRMGKLLRAKNLVNGSFMVRAGRNITINSNLIDVPDKDRSGIGEFEGDINELLDLEKKIVFSTLKNLNIKLSNDDTRKIRENTTKSIAAFLAYCNGLDNYDQGSLQAALSNFQEAIKLDPKFKLALNMAEISNALIIVERGNFPAKHPEILKRRFAAAGGRRVRSGVSLQQQNITRMRLQQISQNLALGYLPGNQSRNGSSDITNNPDIFDQIDEWEEPVIILPEPPSPPNELPEFP